MAEKKKPVKRKITIKRKKKVAPKTKTKIIRPKVGKKIKLLA